MRCNWENWLGRLHRFSFMDRRSNRIASVVSSLAPANSTILDVGAGNGKLASKILRLRPDLKISGVDVLRWPDQHISIAEFDGRKIPAIDNEWDYCLVSDVLHHCESPSELIEEMVRVARRGILIKDHIANGRFDHFVLTLMDWLGNRGHGVHLAYEYWSWAKWKSEFARLNLTEIQTVHSLYLYPRPISWLCDRKLQFICHLEKSSPTMNGLTTTTSQNR